MAVKRLIGRKGKKYRTCLRCGTAIDGTLRDDTVYICPKCGQKHFVDIYPDMLALTATEYPEMRKRHVQAPTTEGAKNRKRLLRREEMKKDIQRQQADAWEDTYRAWLDEVAALPEEELQREYSYMGEEMKARVKSYVDKVRK